MDSSSTVTVQCTNSISKHSVVALHWLKVKGFLLCARVKKSVRITQETPLIIGCDPNVSESVIGAERIIITEVPS